MIALALVVIIGIVLVYLSATKNPFVEEGESPTVNQENLNQEQQPENNNQNTEESAPTATQQPEEESDVVATITLEDNEPAEKQIERASKNQASPQNNEMMYTIKMRSAWSEQLHPQFHPEGSHLSPMVAWSHRLENILFKESIRASEGMEIMAETGATKKLVKEIESITSVGGIYSHNTDSGPLFTPGERKIQIKMSRDAPYITVVSMIAPSPDWFITARNIQLYENGRWLDRVSIPAVLYDAGTDSGTTFTVEDKDTNPKQLITKIKNIPPLPIAVFEFVRN